jgi:hypothetical protein
MRHLRLVVGLLLGLVAPAHGEAIAPSVATEGLLCRSAVAAAERSSGIPDHLLAAISRVESGRRDPVTLAVHPWPWTVNAEGNGYFYDTKAEAISAVRAMQARGVQSIDVGGAQINLMHHPNAFSSLEQAFDPQANTAYAARFLKDLYGQTGDWAKAAALYHSATPELAADYERKVLAVWPEEKRLAGLVGASPLARAWAATMPTPMPNFTRFPPPLRSAGLSPAPRIIMQPSIGGVTPQGRSLAAYRAAPIGLAFQPPPRRSGP